MSDRHATTQACKYPDCGGAPLHEGRCLEHVSPEELAAVAGSLAENVRFDVRGTTISRERLASLLDAMRRDAERPRLWRADLRGATLGAGADLRECEFHGEARFDGCDFEGDVRFERCRFAGDACFDRCRFDGDARFDACRIGGEASFRNAAFASYAGFDGAHFEGKTMFTRAMFAGFARFSRATFGAEVRFSNVRFSTYAGFTDTVFLGQARFGGARFDGYPRFLRASFRGRVAFPGATFREDLDMRLATIVGDLELRWATVGGSSRLDGVSVGGSATFASTTFEHARQIGPMVVADRMVLDSAVFGERVHIDVRARIVSMQATTFAGGTHLQLPGAEIALRDADFGRASTLTGRAAAAQVAASRANADMTAGECGRPRLLTLAGAHVADLSLSDVDLRACRFFGAHGIESLRIESSCTWPRTPAGARRIDRETIAEEHRCHGWNDPSTVAAAWLDQDRVEEALSPSQVAALYRGLRKAREDGKDQAGAGDLYYGEMEMRRQAAASAERGRGYLRALADRIVLTLYWLLSGYGMRASRALVALAVVVSVAAVGMASWGFETAQTSTRAWLFCLESTSGLLRAPNTSGVELTYMGERIQIALRLLGPLLIGLALLAVRARVKR